MKYLKKSSLQTIRDFFKEKIYKTYLEFEPSQRKRRIYLSKWRSTSISEINQLSKSTWKLKKKGKFRNILIDGVWDNPNYWIRFAFFRSAIGCQHSNQTGLLGKYNRKKVLNTFSQFDINKVIDYKKRLVIKESHMENAKCLLKNTSHVKDILTWVLPFDFPAKIFYDVFLKRQRRPTVDINDPDLCGYIAEGLACLDISSSILEEEKFDIVLLSHATDFIYGSIAWNAIRKNVPVYVLYGDYNSCRFIRLKNKIDIFNYPSRPTFDEIREITREKKEYLIKAGRKYLEMRLSGNTDDIGAIHSYKRRNASINKKEICCHNNWNINDQLVGIYLSNWFDYPHSYGLHDYYDFLDWILTVLNVIKKMKNINWLIRTHPCDDWYGGNRGVTIQEIVNNMNLPHIQLAKNEWNGKSFIQSIDGVITYHGTIALEASFLDTPVLVASPNCWYTSGDFITKVNNRDEFLSHIQNNNWLIQPRQSKDNIALHAGLYWGMPDWESLFIFEDDSHQESIYVNLPERLNESKNGIKKEIDCIRSWIECDHEYYHIYKMLHFDVNKAPVS